MNILCSNVDSVKFFEYIVLRKSYDIIIFDVLIYYYFEDNNAMNVYCRSYKIFSIVSDTYTIMLNTQK